MEHEYEVLAHINEDELTAQRKISQHTELSHGAVNLLLNKMTCKGLVKVEKLNARTVHFVLPPQGIKEKPHLAYRFIQKSYKQILKINQLTDQSHPACRLMEMLNLASDQQRGKQFAGNRQNEPLL